MRGFLRRTDTRWQQAEVLLLSLALGSIIVLGAGQILLRNLAETGWVWADPVIRHLVLVVGFLGGSLAAAQGRHIRIDALAHLLAGKKARVARIVTGLVTTAVAIILAVASWDFVQMEREAGGSPWYFQLVIPYTFASVAIRSFFLSFARETSS